MVLASETRGLLVLAIAVDWRLATVSLSEATLGAFGEAADAVFGAVRTLLARFKPAVGAVGLSPTDEIRALLAFV